VPSRYVKEPLRLETRAFSRFADRIFRDWRNVACLAASGLYTKLPLGFWLVWLIGTWKLGFLAWQRLLARFRLAGPHNVVVLACGPLALASALPNGRKDVVKRALDWLVHFLWSAHIFETFLIGEMHLSKYFPPQPFKSLFDNE